MENILKGQHLTIEIVKAEEDCFVARCLDIPGCISQGDTEQEAFSNIIQAIQVCLSVMIEDRLQKPVQRAFISDEVVSEKRLTICVPELREQFAHC